MSKKEKTKNSQKAITITMVILLIAIFIITIILGLIRIGMENNWFAESNKIETNTEKQEFVEVLEDGTKLNVSDKMKEVKKFEEFEISNLKVTENNNVTLLEGTITNVGKTEEGGYPVNLIIKDKEGKEIITIAAFIGKLEPGKSTQLSTSATFDYSNAYDFSISKR